MEKKQPSKKELKAKATRKKIILAATTLFTRQGFHKTTVSDIAQFINMTTGALFHHFASKEAILEAVVDRLAHGIEIYSQALNQQPEGSLDAVADMIDFMLAHYDRHPEATICLAALSTEFAGSGHPMELRLKEIYEIFISAFSRFIQGHPRVTNPRAAAIAILGAAHGIGIQSLFREGEVHVREVADGLIALLQPW